MKVTFEMCEQDAAAIARYLESGHYRPGSCHLSVNLDRVDDPRAHLWTGAHGWLRVELGKTEGQK